MYQTNDNDAMSTNKNDEISTYKPPAANSQKMEVNLKTLNILIPSLTASLLLNVACVCIIVFKILRKRQSANDRQVRSNEIPMQTFNV